MKSSLKCKCGKVVNFSKSDFARMTEKEKRNFKCADCLRKPPKIGEKKAEKKEYKSQLNTVLKDKENGENNL